MISSPSESNVSLGMGSWQGIIKSNESSVFKMLQDDDTKVFRRMMRMDEATYMFLLQMLETALTKQRTRM